MLAKIWEWYNEFQCFGQDVYEIFVLKRLPTRLLKERWQVTLADLIQQEKQLGIPTRAHLRAIGGVLPQLFSDQGLQLLLHCASVDEFQTDPTLYKDKAVFLHKLFPIIDRVDSHDDHQFSYLVCDIQAFLAQTLTALFPPGEGGSPPLQLTEKSADVASVSSSICLSDLPWLAEQPNRLYYYYRTIFDLPLPLKEGSVLQRLVALLFCIKVYRIDLYFKLPPWSTSTIVYLAFVLKYLAQGMASQVEGGRFEIMLNHYPIEIVSDDLLQVNSEKTFYIKWFDP